MTFTEEYLGDEDDLKVESSYPNAFGITFTPKVSGIALGVLGVLGSLYLALNWLLPLYSKYQQLKADEASKQEQINQKKSGDLDRKIENLQVQLQQKEAQKEQVLAMFAKERDLDTIVLDVSNLLKNRNVELLSFIPQGNPVVIDDGSLGAAVNKKLKRQTYSAKLQGGFESTQAVIRDLERLQPLVIVRGLKSQAQEEKEVSIIRTAPTSFQVIPKAEPPISTDLQLDVIIPLNAEEIAKLAPPPPPPEQGQQPPAEEKK